MENKWVKNASIKYRLGEESYPLLIPLKNECVRDLGVYSTK